VNEFILSSDSISIIQTVQNSTGFDRNLPLCCKWHAWSLFEYFVGTSHAGLTDPDLLGRNILYSAAGSNNLAVGLMCLRMNPTMDTLEGTSGREWFGRSALQVAAEEGHAEFVELMVAARADVNHADVWGDTALHLSARGGWWECVRVLLARATCLPNIKNVRGEVAIHLAARVDAATIKEFVGSPKVDVNAKDAKGRTALHIIAKTGTADMCEEMLRSPAIQTALTDNAGRTPMDVATGQHRAQLFTGLTSRVESGARCLIF
jgi:ankyrin repeat protein